MSAPSSCIAARQRFFTPAAAPDAPDAAGAATDDVDFDALPRVPIDDGPATEPNLAPRSAAKRAPKRTLATPAPTTGRAPTTNRAPKKEAPRAPQKGPAPPRKERSAAEPKKPKPTPKALAKPPRAQRRSNS